MAPTPAKHRISATERILLQSLLNLNEVGVMQSHAKAIRHLAEMVKELADYVHRLEQVISVNNSGDVSITSQKTLEVRSAGNISVKAAGNLDLKAMGFLNTEGQKRPLRP